MRLQNLSMDILFYISSYLTPEQFYLLTLTEKFFYHGPSSLKWKFLQQLFSNKKTEENIKRQHRIFNNGLLIADFSSRLSALCLITIFKENIKATTPEYYLKTTLILNVLQNQESLYLPPARKTFKDKDLFIFLINNASFDETAFIKSAIKDVTSLNVIAEMFACFAETFSFLRRRNQIIITNIVSKKLKNFLDLQLQEIYDARTSMHPNQIYIAKAFADNVKILAELLKVITQFSTEMQEAGVQKNIQKISNTLSTSVKKWKKKSAKSSLEGDLEIFLTALFPYLPESKKISILNTKVVEFNNINKNIDYEFLLENKENLNENQHKHLLTVIRNNLIKDPRNSSVKHLIGFKKLSQFLRRADINRNLRDEVIIILTAQASREENHYCDVIANLFSALSENDQKHYDTITDLVFEKMSEGPLVPDFIQFGPPRSYMFWIEFLPELINHPKVKPQKKSEILKIVIHKLITEDTTLGKAKTVKVILDKCNYSDKLNEDDKKGISKELKKQLYDFEKIFAMPANAKSYIMYVDILMDCQLEANNSIVPEIVAHYVNTTLTNHHRGQFTLHILMHSPLTLVMTPDQITAITNVLHTILNNMRSVRGEAVYDIARCAQLYPRNNEKAFEDEIKFAIEHLNNFVFALAERNQELKGYYLIIKILINTSENIKDIQRRIYNIIINRLKTQPSLYYDKEIDNILLLLNNGHISIDELILTFNSLLLSAEPDIRCLLNLIIFGIPKIFSKIKILVNNNNFIELVIKIIDLLKSEHKTTYFYDENYFYIYKLFLQFILDHFAYSSVSYHAQFTSLKDLILDRFYDMGSNFPLSDQESALLFWLINQEAKEEQEKTIRKIINRSHDSSFNIQKKVISTFPIITKCMNQKDFEEQQTRVKCFNGCSKVSLFFSIISANPSIRTSALNI